MLLLRTQGWAMCCFDHSTREQTWPVPRFLSPSDGICVLYACPPLLRAVFTTPEHPPPSRFVCRAFAALAYSLSSEVARWRLRDVFSVTYNGPYRPSTRQQLLRDDNGAFVQLKQCWAFFTPQELPRASENFILWPSSVELLKFYGQIGAWWGSITVPGCM